uniref:Uncharacterized protein n=1 Tax=Opuntia streptacantha TaxID=393608 RepID=A0A7C8ZT43_OPUST
MTTSALKRKPSLAPFWNMQLNHPLHGITTPKRKRFCYMEPFNGRCEMPEQKVGRGVITIGTKRLGHSSGAGGGKEGVDNDGAQGKTEDNSNEIGEDNIEVERPALKRLRRGSQKVSAKK